MSILDGLAWLVIGAFAAWPFVQWRAAAELARLQMQMEERIRYWQDETERARTTTAQLSERTAAWMAGCQQGREDILSLARALAQHGTRDHGDPQGR